MVTAAPAYTQVQEIIEAQLHVRTRFEEIAPPIDADATVKELFKRDARRVWLIICNLSANTVVVRPNANATTTQGIRLDANGGFVVMSVLEDAIMPTLQWTVIASLDNSAIYAAQLIIEAP